MDKNKNLNYVGISPWVERNKCDLTQYVHLATKHTFESGQAIVEGGTLLESMFYLERGLVKASICNPDGSEKMLFILDDKTIFGEVSCFSRTVSNTSFRSIEPSVVYRFDFQTIETILDQDPAVAKAFLTVMSRKTKTLVSQLGDSIVNDPRYRLLKALYVLKLECGFEENGSWIIPRKFTHQQLADSTGLHRVTISNLLSKLQKEKILKKEKERIIIYDWAYITENVL